jgi:hypothetical protein
VGVSLLKSDRYVVILPTHSASASSSTWSAVDLGTRPDSPSEMVTGHSASASSSTWSAVHLGTRPDSPSEMVKKTCV